MVLREDLKSKSGSAWLGMRAMVNTQKVVISLGLSCPVENWDKERERVVFKANGTVKRELVNQWNDLIVRFTDRANDLRHRYDMMNQVLTPEMFRREMRDDSRTQSFTGFIEKLIPKLALKWDRDTIGHYNVTLNRLKQYQAIINFGDLNGDFLTGFEHFLKGQKLGPNTIWKYHKVLKMFINEAIKSGIRLVNPYENYKVIRVKSKRDYLSGDEVIQLRDLLLSGKMHPSHDHILRYFLFSCYTGLRISDVMTVTYDDIVDGQLIFIPKKTRRFNKILKMPLNETALWLVGKGKGKIFNTFAEQVTNRYLKEIASIANIKKNLTFHVSRHTFAMRFLEKGGKVEVLKELLGHSDIATTMEYVHELNHLAKQQIMLLDE